MSLTSVLINTKEFNKTFEKALELSSELFDISKEDILSKSSKRRITDIKKIIVYKFYNLKKHDKDNIVNLLSKVFNCGHSNVVYWYNKAKELYSIDYSFKSNYNIFSDNLDSYIINFKKS